MELLQYIRLSDLDLFVGHVVAVRLRDMLIDKAPGHCAQITDLSDSVLEYACRELRSLCAGLIEGYLLSNRTRDERTEIEITATKLVERRNAEERVVVVFIPPNLRTAAEDSFDRATFEIIQIPNIYRSLVEDWYEEVLAKFIDTPYGQSFIELVETITNNQRDLHLEDTHWALFYRSILVNNCGPDAVGASLAYLNLVPDLPILQDRTVRARIKDNMVVISKLNDNTKPLHERLQHLIIDNKSIKSELQEILRKASQHVDFAAWVQDIFKQPSKLEKLSFHLWRDGIGPNIQLESLKILGIEGDALESRGGDYSELKVSGGGTLTIKYQAHPAPPRCEDWDKVEVHLLDMGGRNDGREDRFPSVEIICSFKKPKTNTKIYSKKITAKQLGKLADADPSVYALGLRAVTSDGFILVEDVSPEKFSFVISQEPVDIPSPRQPIASAQICLLLDYLKAIENGESYVFNASNYRVMEEGNNSTPGDHLQIYSELSKQIYVLPVTHFLQELQGHIMEDGENLGILRLVGVSESSFRGDDWQNYLQFADVLEPEDAGTCAAVLSSFYRERSALFRAILKKTAQTGVVTSYQGLDLCELAWRYVESYRSLLTAANKAGDKNLDQIRLVDTIYLETAEGNSFYLLSPTHPLRLAWSLTYEEVFTSLNREMKKLPKSDYSLSGLKQLFQQMSGLHYPNILRGHDGRWFLNSDVVGNNWLIMVPEEHFGDISFLGNFYTMLKCSPQVKRERHFDANRVAERIYRYLVKHPYLNTLTINVFEPGNGEDIVQLLEQIDKILWDKKCNTFQDIRIRLRLFSSGMEGLKRSGCALDQIMDTGEEKYVHDDFRLRLTLENENPLFPKFTYSKHFTEDFLKNPSLFASNICLMQQMLQIKVGIADPEEYESLRSDYFEGLYYEYASMSNNAYDCEAGLFWKKVLVPGRNQKLSDLFYKFEGAQLKLIPFINEIEHLPCIIIDMPVEVKKLLFDVHRYTDWVIISDTLLGIDFLDRPSSGRDRYNLIDYIPRKNLTDAHLFVSTDRVKEVEFLVRPVLKELGLRVKEGAERAIIDSLNSISGRLALKLTMGDTAVKDAIGMSLARLYIEEMRQNGPVAENMIMIPVDSHPEWYDDRGEDQLSLRRTDILGVVCDRSQRILHCHLLEVKWRQDVNFKSPEMISLRENIEEQLEGTRQILYSRFNYKNYLRSFHGNIKEWMDILSFYLERAYRYKSMNLWDYEQARSLIITLDQGYEMVFHKHGLIFSPGYSGVDIVKYDAVNYHLIGRNWIEASLEGAGDVFITDRFNKEEYQTQLNHRSELFSLPILPKITEALVAEEEVAIAGSSEEYKVEKNEEVSDENLYKEEVRDEESFEDNDVEPVDISSAHADIILGDGDFTRQFCVIGKNMGGEVVAMDLDGCITMSLFGVQGMVWARA